MLYVPRNRRGSASRPYCPNHSSLRSQDLSLVPRGPCTVSSPRSCIEAANSGIRFQPSAVHVSGTVGNRYGGSHVHGGARSRRTVNYFAASISDGSPRTTHMTNNILYKSVIKWLSCHNNWPNAYYTLNFRI